jgi:hypothetical protein
MRHLGSLLLSLLLAPVIWLLTGVGLNEFFRARERLTDFGPELGLGLGALLAAGLLYAVLVLPRLSPVGPAVAGLAYVVMTTWSAVDGLSLYRTLPRSFLGADNALTFPAEGYAALLAMPLLATLVSPRRWRRHDRVAARPYQPYQAATPHQNPQGPYPPAGPAPAGPYPPAHQPAPTRHDLPPVPAVSGWSPPSAHQRPIEEETTTRLNAGTRPSAARPDDGPTDRPTEDLGEQTRPLTGTPPPSAAYPPPGHAAATAPPVTPAAPPPTAPAAPPSSPLEDPDATRRL